ncbi:hypothetical protein GCM10027160_53480 [Streptomyces calidiresistens]|uniref:Uncharacterized protein n=1 Tax=Streptomyces calidiresistens TaxID=1485586 RepID=A0A7W3T2S1_9ACTN|nr:hypothetical protein [Streptomyces calidiresistens]MBB0229862.1 hypothetical protein [Streptomyces calidiresistens]
MRWPTRTAGWKNCTAAPPEDHGAAHDDGWDTAVDRALDVLVRVADNAYRQRGRARATRTLPAGGEILRAHEPAADQRAAGAGSCGERGDDRDR